MDKLLSVVIPTKNRYETLIPLLSAIACYADEEMEIVIQDNSDVNILMLNWLKENPNSNIKYFYDSKWKSVVDNCDDAILNSTGEFVTLIGDDDAISPQILQVVKLLKKYQIETCTCNYSLYRWGQALLPNKKSYEYIFNYKKSKLIDVKKRIKQVMKGGIQNKEGLPCVYHGLVSRRILDELYSQTGSYFPGPSPDMANAFGVSMIVKNNLIVTIPFIIDGYSKSSTGHLTENKKHVGKIEEQHFLPNDTAENWIKEIPFVWLPNTIWPDSGIQAIMRCGKEEQLKHMSFAALYIKIKRIYPEFAILCKEYIKKYCSRWSYFNAYIYVAIHFLINRVKEKLQRKRVCLDTPISLHEAIKINSDLIEEKGMVQDLKKQLSKIYSKEI